MPMLPPADSGTGDLRVDFRAGRRLTVAWLVASSLFMAVSLLVAGCGGEGLVGAWTSPEQGETVEFRPDGTVVLTMSSGVMATLTYEAKGNSLIFGAGGGPTRTFGYSIKGGVLTLTFPGEEPAAYARVRLDDS
jgi:hypothetical protein